MSPTPGSTGFRPRTDYSRLPTGFSDSVKAASFPKRVLRFWNETWAKRVGLDSLSPSEREKYFAQFDPLPGAQASPLAMRYHGHQFRHYNPNLGDGRGFLYAQCEDLIDGRCLDFGTKGSGQTPYSRAGDGRLTLKGAVREALATEMLESLGVNTSKTFSFFETGEALQRNDEPSPTRSAVLTRLSHGHIRFGSFQRLSALGEIEKTRELMDYSLALYWPNEGPSENLLNRTARFLELVVEGSAKMTAQWMMAGFVHGVLNTDNMNITGESFDYGPWRFLPFYEPSFTAAYFDHEGLYSYARQPEAVYWNLDQLARSLFPMAPQGPAAASDETELWQSKFVQKLEPFPLIFKKYLLQAFFAKLGLHKIDDGATGSETRSETVFTAAFDHLRESKCGFEDFFFDWFGGSSDSRSATFSENFQRVLREGFESGWLKVRPESPQILDERARSGVTRAETILIDEVEKIWAAIESRDDWTLFDQKIAALRRRSLTHGALS